MRNTMLHLTSRISKYLNEYLITNLWNKTSQFAMREAETVSEVTRPSGSSQAQRNVQKERRDTN